VTVNTQFWEQRNQYLSKKLEYINEKNYLKAHAPRGYINHSYLHVQPHHCKTTFKNTSNFLYKILSIIRDRTNNLYAHNNWCCVTNVYMMYSTSARYIRIISNTFCTQNFNCSDPCRKLHDTIERIISYKIRAISISKIRERRSFFTARRLKNK